MPVPETGVGSTRRNALVLSSPQRWYAQDQTDWAAGARPKASGLDDPDGGHGHADEADRVVPAAGHVLTSLSNHFDSAPWTTSSSSCYLFHPVEVSGRRPGIIRLG